MDATGLRVQVLNKTRKTVIGGAERSEDARTDVPLLLIDAASDSIEAFDIIEEEEDGEEEDGEEEEEEDKEQQPRNESLKSLSSKLVNRIKLRRSTKRVAKSRLDSLVRAFDKDRITS